MPNTREKLIELIETTVPREKVAAYGEVPITVGQIADHLIANGVILDNQVSSSKWIPVTKMVPESHVERMDDLGETLYYVCSDFVLGYTDHGQFVCVQHLVEDEKDYWIDDFGTEYTVTHWMPLPEKPEGV